eukprot:1488846-Karenia_brevis.AAC.1
MDGQASQSTGRTEAKDAEMSDAARAKSSSTETKDAEMSEAARKKVSMAHMCYDKSKSGPEDDQR